MSYNCDNCAWPTADDMETDIHGNEVNPMPEYVRVNGTQITRCPNCAETFETQENNTRAI